MTNQKYHASPYWYTIARCYFILWGETFKVQIKSTPSPYEYTLARWYFALCGAASTRVRHNKSINIRPIGNCYTLDKILFYTMQRDLKGTFSFRNYGILQECKCIPIGGRMVILKRTVCRAEGANFFEIWEHQMHSGNRKSSLGTLHFQIFRRCAAALYP